jgi:uridine kinase
MDQVKIIGIAGGSGSGKTTIVRKIGELVPNFLCIAQDNYYLSAEHVSNTNITAFNFDHPSAFDTPLLVEQLRLLKKGVSIQMPQYDFVHHRRKKEAISLNPQPIIILEGIMIYFEKAVRDLIDLKLYVDTPDDIRFIRRLQRDMIERGRTMESVISQYIDVVRPGHFQFIEPTKVFADLIVPEGGNNQAALDVLSSFMRNLIAQ